MSVVACIYLAAIFLFGPPFIARKHPFTWKLDFQQNVDRLATKVSSEEELIDALRIRGFEMWMRPENPITYRENGLRSISYKDPDRSYTTYAEFVQAHDRFEAAFPEDEREHPRVAETGYGLVACRHHFTITWHLQGDEIIDLTAKDGWACL
ncbi:MAG: hypothetical protein R3D45_00590 [Rhizobiaceae bacterium]